MFYYLPQETRKEKFVESILSESDPTAIRSKFESVVQ